MSHALGTNRQSMALGWAAVPLAAFEGIDWASMTTGWQISCIAETEIHNTFKLFPSSRFIQLVLIPPLS